MKITDKVKVGGFVYDVKREKGSFVGSNGQALDGEYSFSNKTITIGGNGCDAYREVVFLHEVVHAIIEHYVSPAEHDEQFVEQFSKGLYQVIQDNAEIFGNG